MTKLTSLQKAVLNQMGYDALTEEACETLADVAAHGADGGFSGFIYYTDTREFALDNLAIIRERLKQDAEDFGVGLLEMVQVFRCLNPSGRAEDAYSVDDIAEVLYGGDTDSEESTQILNALAWYAMETVALDLVGD